MARPDGLWSPWVIGQKQLRSIVQRDRTLSASACFLLTQGIRSTIGGAEVSPYHGLFNSLPKAPAGIMLQRCNVCSCMPHAVTVAYEGPYFCSKWKSDWRLANTTILLNENIQTKCNNSPFIDSTSTLILGPYALCDLRHQ